MKRVRIAIYIDQERWRHEMWVCLSLFIQNIVVRVSNYWSVICVEKLLTGNLTISIT